MRGLVLDRAARLVVPLALLYAIYLLLAGHDRPGGGFSAGLVSALALVVQGLASGEARVHARTRRLLRPALPLGLALAIASGLPALARGEPFLRHFHGPGPLSTALLFDVGVYLVVVGAVAVLLHRLAGSEK